MHGVTSSSGPFGLVGGGIGYPRIVSAEQATHVVKDKAELLAALAVARSGDVVYVDATSINLTGEFGIKIPGGVTLAGGRGSRNYYLGPRLLTNDLAGEPLFEAGGDDVRITGLRFKGPYAEADANEAADRRGVSSNTHQRFEVDNCDFYYWPRAAVYINRGSLQGIHVHHNFFHKNQRGGLGYGVSVRRAAALIEYNLFSNNRHAITAAGFPGESYEACFNVVLSQSNDGHAFDVHGGSDREDGTHVAGDWFHIHHNTSYLRDADPRTVGIRGIPTIGCIVEWNLFNTTTIAQAASQTRASGNMTIRDNALAAHRLDVATRTFYMPPVPPMPIPEIPNPFE